MNSPPTCAKAPQLRPPAVIRLAIRETPTGSLAPDSLSRMVPARPDTSRRPRTEKTTVGSVGATAVTASNDTYQAETERDMAEQCAGGGGQERLGHPDNGDGARRRAEQGPPDVHAAVEEHAYQRHRDDRSTVLSGGACKKGTTLTTIAAPASTNAGDGTLTRSIRRLDNTTTSPTTAVSNMSNADDSGSVTTVCSHRARLQLADQTSRRTTLEVIRRATSHPDGPIVANTVGMWRIRRSSLRRVDGVCRSGSRGAAGEEFRAFWDIRHRRRRREGDRTVDDGGPDCPRAGGIAAAEASSVRLAAEG
jgi:hypothetical protein